MEPNNLETGPCLFKRKKSLDYLVGPEKKDGDLATRPANQIDQIIRLLTQNIKTVYLNR